MASCVSLSTSPALRRKRGFYEAPELALESKRRRVDDLCRLRQLFPMIDDATVRGVFDACANDVDAAIARLSQLALATAKPPPAPPAEEKEAWVDEPQTPDAWVGAFVAEMARSADVGDARQRAARALRAFERFVSSRSSKEGEDRARAAEAKAEELDKQNAVLRKALVVQNRRLEAAADDAARLSREKAAAVEALRRAEKTNYALSVHFARAADEAARGGRGPPDVF